MKRFSKLALGIMIATVAIVCPFKEIKAAGTVSISGDKETANVGDTYTVLVEVKDADGAAEAPEISVSFDANRLSFSSCSTEYGGGAGGLITLSDNSSEIAFNILSGGQADVEVTAIFDGDGANPQTATATVMVEGEDTAALNADGTDGGSDFGIVAGSIATPDGNVVNTVFADEFMPVGFYKTTVSYNEQMVEAAQFDMGNIVLLYVTDADGNNGNFDIYDQSTGELSDFLQIAGIENRFIIAQKPGADVTVPDGFALASLQWNAQTLDAYSYTGAQGDSVVSASDFFLLYAVSSEGNRGWYLYDQNEGTYQRYVEGLHAGAQSSDTGLLSQIASSTDLDSDKGGVNVMLIIVIAMGVIVLALIIAVIIMAMKLHEFNSYDYIDEDEEEDYLQKMAQSQNEAPVSEPEPQKENIFEKYRREDEEKEQEVLVEKVDDDREMFSPRDIKNDVEDDEEDYFDRKLTRAEKKELKKEEKARKKAEKKMKREYGEYGPVDWDSWQQAVESGEKTAASAARQREISETQAMDMEALNNVSADIPVEEKPERKPTPKKEDDGFIRRNAKVEEEIYEEQTTPKDNPMEMMRNIPANDNKAPVQAKPVQQFDLDDDFEFEFLSLDDD